MKSVGKNIGITLLPLDYEHFQFHQTSVQNVLFIE